MDNSKIVFLINDQARAVMASYEPGATPEMFKRADAENTAAMAAYARFLHNEAPCGCYGSPDHVKDWIAQGGLRGMDA